MNSNSYDNINKLIEYKNYINNIGDNMPESFEKLQASIYSINKFRSLLAIILATELMSFKLRALIIIDDLIIQLRKWLENNEYVISRINEHSKKSFGQILNEFNKRYNFKENNKSLYNELEILNNKRNEIIHRSIFEYRGNLDKANLYIKEYVTPKKYQYKGELIQILDYLQREITNIFNERKKVSDDVIKQVEQTGLINNTEIRYTVI